MFDQAVVAVAAPDAAHAVVEGAHPTYDVVFARDEEARSVGPLDGDRLQDRAFAAGADGAELSVVGAVAEGEPDQVEVALDVAESAVGLVVGGVKEVVEAAGLHQGLVGVLSCGQDGVHGARVIGRACEKEGALAQVAAGVDSLEHLSVGNEDVAPPGVTEEVVGAFVAVPEGVEGPGEAKGIAVRGP